MTFANPEWFLLIPALAAAGWWWRGLGFHQPLRAGILLLLVLILVRPRAMLRKDGMDLWVLLDRSASTGDRVDAALPEWRKLLEDGRRSRDDRIIYVDYALDAVPPAMNNNQPFTGSRALTRTGMAIQNVLAMRDSEKPARILAFTDGFSTEPLTGLADKLLKSGVPLDVRFIGELQGRDFRVRRFDMPPRVQSGEPFLVEVEVTGPEDAEIPLQIFRAGQKLTDTTVKVEGGRGVARFTEKVPVTGAFPYQARILPSGDVHAGNDVADAWVEVAGGPRILLITRYVDDPLAKVMETQGCTVETVREPAKLHPGQLGGCRGVVINNVPAHEIPQEFLASLDFFVQAQGGGLLMAGGKGSFGSGGYFHSAVDPLLPVSMELKEDIRRIATAMVIVMDRSGSMAAPAGGGTKMDLADEGAANAIDLLGLSDSVGVYAVDSEAHEVVAMQKIGSESNRRTMTKDVRGVQSQGGGIFVYEGLNAAWSDLKETPYGTRHIILFSDAADSEEPGDYKKLLEEMTKAGGTVSVIALGSEQDTDAQLLKDIAKLGNGRIFFTTRAEDIPSIFTQETVAVARSAFVKEPVGTQPTGSWAELGTSKPMQWLSEVDGYNLSYRRDWASQALVTTDEFEAPLVAWGLRGAGRTAAVTFPLGGEFSERARGWAGYGDFMQTLARWLKGDELPGDLGLRWKVQGTELLVDLHFSGEWEQKFAANAPKVMIAEGMRADRKRELVWQRIGPGRYQVSTELAEGEVVRGAIQADRHTISFGPTTVGTSAEWAFDQARVEELRQTALLSGGRELVDIKTAWQESGAREFSDLRNWLLLAALLLILTEALLTRTGWKLPQWQHLRRKSAGPAPAPALKARPARTADIPAPSATAAAPDPAGTPSPVLPATPPAPKAPAPPTPADAAEDAEKRRQRFARAKK